jgi:uncharacterized membrane protein
MIEFILNNKPIKTIQPSSKHNTYMSIPVIFIMISSHFPVTTYGNTDNWLMLGIFILIGWAGAKWMRG